MFGGTRDKCLGCQKTVYPTEKVISASLDRDTVILLKLQSLAFARITIAHRDSAKLNTNQKKVMFEVGDEFGRISKCDHDFGES
jgi:hypothetical protein